MASPLSFAPLLGNEPDAAGAARAMAGGGRPAEIVWDIHDGTTRQGVTDRALAILNAAAVAAGAAGLARIVVTAGHGLGGHRSHYAGSELDIKAYNPDGSRWTNEQRVAVAEGARGGGADRLGVYQMTKGIGKGTLHFGYSGRGRPPAIWGAGGKLSRDEGGRNFTHPAEVALLRAYESGRPLNLESVGIRTAAAPAPVPVGRPLSYAPVMSMLDRANPLNAVAAAPKLTGTMTGGVGGGAPMTVKGEFAPPLQLGQPSMGGGGGAGSAMTVRPGAEFLPPKDGEVPALGPVTMQGSAGGGAPMLPSASSMGEIIRGWVESLPGKGAVAEPGQAPQPGQIGRDDFDQAVNGWGLNGRNDGVRSPYESQLQQVLNPRAEQAGTDRSVARGVPEYFRQPDVGVFPSAQGGAKHLPQSPYYARESAPTVAPAAFSGQGVRNVSTAGPPMSANMIAGMPMIDPQGAGLRPTLYADVPADASSRPVNMANIDSRPGISPDVAQPGNNIASRFADAFQAPAAQSVPPALAAGVQARFADAFAPPMAQAAPAPSEARPWAAADAQQAPAQAMRADAPLGPSFMQAMANAARQSAPSPAPPVALEAPRQEVQADRTIPVVNADPEPELGPSMYRSYANQAAAKAAAPPQVRAPNPPMAAPRMMGMASKPDPVTQMALGARSQQAVAKAIEQVLVRQAALQSVQSAPSQRSVARIQQPPPMISRAPVRGAAPSLNAPMLAGGAPNGFAGSFGPSIAFDASGIPYSTGYSGGAGQFGTGWYMPS